MKVETETKNFHGNGKDDHTWPVPYEGNGGRSVGQGRSSTCTQSEIIEKYICLIAECIFLK